MSRTQITAAGIRDLLRERTRIWGSQRRLARDLGVSEQFLSQVLHEHREPSGRLTKMLGYRRIVVYERVNRRPTR